MRTWLQSGLVGLTLALTPTPAVAQETIEPLGAQLRVTQTGVDGDAGIDAERASIAYDPERDHYLLVYDAIKPDARSERWVFSRLLDGGGSPLGEPVPLALAGPASAGGDEIPSPDVAYSPGSDIYVVAFDGVPSGAVAGHHEISTVAVSADGGKVAGPTRISTSGSGIDDPDRDAQRPAIAHDPQANTFLVTWETDGFSALANDEFEIAERVVTSAGAPLFADRRLSVNGPAADAGFDAFSPRAVYVPGIEPSYVVVWAGDAGAAGDSEIFVRSVTPSTGSADSSQQQITDFPTTGANAYATDVALDERAGELLVAFLGEPQRLGGFRDAEVYVQRVSAATLDAIGDKRQISQIGPPLSTAFNATMPRVGYHPALDRYLVTWRADGALTGLADNEWEIFGQVLAPDATDVGDDQRISVVGGDGDDSADAVEAANDVFYTRRYGLAVNTSRREWLVAFAADPASNDEFEIYDRRFGERDADGDGSPVSADCDDGDASVHRGAPDIPDNGRDEDCDGLDAVNLDRDGDGEPRPADCDDGNASVHHGAPEIPDNRRDDDCTGGDAINLDRDGDGERRPRDCNDNNPFVHHGIRDIPGNHVDEDCSGRDAPVLLRATVSFKYDRLGSAPAVVRITRLTVAPGRRGMTIALSCQGPGCPRSLRHAHTIHVKQRGPVQLVRFLRSAALRRGAVVEVRVSRRGFIGRIERLKVTRQADLSRTSRCTMPGSKRVRRCPE